jgi:hypothetical protein
VSVNTCGTEEWPSGAWIGVSSLISQQNREPGWPWFCENLTIGSIAGQKSMRDRHNWGYLPMRKTFSCGHTGKGQYCHLCRQKELQMAARVAARNSRISKLAQMEQESGLSLEKIPEQVAAKAVGIVKSIKAGMVYTQFKGKRLMDNRNVVSIPVNYSYRLIMRDGTDGFLPVKVVSHEDYNTEFRDY